MKIIVIGANNSGKGTIVKLLSKKIGFEVIGCSNELEKNGLNIKTGRLLPDHDVNNVMKKHLLGKDNFILEGYPRTLIQNQFMIENLFIPDIIIALNISEEEVLSRAVGRRVCTNCKEIYNLNGFKVPKIENICDKCGSKLEHRKDDTKEAVSTRYFEYVEMTEPIINYYRSETLKTIVWDFDATEKCEDIAEAISDYIKYITS